VFNGDQTVFPCTSMGGKGKDYRIASHIIEGSKIYNLTVRTPDGQEPSDKPTVG